MPCAPSTRCRKRCANASGGTMTIERIAGGKLYGIVCLAALAAQAVSETAIAQPADSDRPASEILVNEHVPNRIPGQYIVTFKRGTSREAVASAQERVKSLGGTIGYTYTAALVGFSFKLPVEGEQAKRALQALRELPGVVSIEVDQVGNLNTI